jgi:mannose-6-phosphate isomerase-like protein (cupin superfamily)
LAPRQASTRHRHTRQDELYVLLEGRGRGRIGGEVLTLEPLSALYVEAETVRQV